MWKWIAQLALAILVALVATGCDESKLVQIKWPSFYPDGDKILFTYVKPGELSTLATYELSTGSYQIHEPVKIDPADTYWGAGSVSRDGKRIVFAIGQKETTNSQLVIMNVDGSDLHKITIGPGIRFLPSFSPDGKKVIYLISGRFRPKGKQKVVNNDVYEVDVATKPCLSGCHPYPLHLGCSQSPE